MCMVQKTPIQVPELFLFHRTVLGDQDPNHILSSMISDVLGFILPHKSNIWGSSVFGLCFFFPFHKTKILFPVSREHKSEPPENIFTFLFWVFSETSSNIRWSNTLQSGHHTPP